MENNGLAFTSQPADIDADDFPQLFEMEPLEIFTSALVQKSHEAEVGLFDRHLGVPAHKQEMLERARVLAPGGGGLNSWGCVGMARSGVGTMTIADGDRVDLSNLSRQFYVASDLGLSKGKRLAANVAGQAFGGATVTGIGLNFEEAIAKYSIPADIIIAGVDNNECRLQVVREARRRNIPAVFSMLGLDGMRCQVFLQNASRSEPCLWCALPNLDPERVLPCASAIISSCFLAAAFTIFFAHRALMGWGDLQPFNWREADLTGRVPDTTGIVKKRVDCPVCAEFK